ncbi:MAG: tyrosine-type recombinase/integrase [Actinomycetota bacterium]|nr:tyrosine-type recombinase/integrase [Actinomycetota bacterium]
MSILRQSLQDYLSVRRSLGFKLERVSHLLPDFVGFMERESITTLTTALALAWAMNTKGSANWQAVRLDIVRGFARFLQAIDPNTEVPSPGLLPRRTQRAVPYIYTDAEISVLMAAAQTLRLRISRATYATLIGLLAVTGMRPGEAIRLDREDVDLARGFLTIRSTKFGKSREVVLHSSTVAALEAYVRRRDELIPHPIGPTFFVSRDGTRLSHGHVDCTYRQLVRQAGLPQLPSRRPPRLHDFRHTFAVHTVIDWYRDGVDVAARLPLLSTYLGHVEPISTYWYFSATPELLALAASRLQRGLGDLR